MVEAYERLLVEVKAEGLKELDHAPGSVEMRIGARVRQRNPLTAATRGDGTATVRAVLGRSEGGQGWEATWGDTTVELIVELDDGTFERWPHHGTVFVTDWSAR